MNDFKLVDSHTGKTRYFDSRSEAQDAKEDLEGLTEGELTIERVDGQEVAQAPEVVEDAQNDAQEQEQAMDTQEQSSPLLQEPSVDTDPLDILPSYMITMVDGKPSLNKRGVSVLAYHYDIDVESHDVVAYPHETDFEAAIVKTIVAGPDGRNFVGSGEAHVDETPKHQLLRMAETRAYKRAVIFATGTGLVGYQELMEELE